MPKISEGQLGHDAKSYEFEFPEVWYFTFLLIEKHYRFICLGLL